MYVYIDVIFFGYFRRSIESQVQHIPDNTYDKILNFVFFVTNCLQLSNRAYNQHLNIYHIIIRYFCTWRPLTRLFLYTNDQTLDKCVCTVWEKQSIKRYTSPPGTTLQVTRLGHTIIQIRLFRSSSKLRHFKFDWGESCSYIYYINAENYTKIMSLKRFVL